VAAECIGIARSPLTLPSGARKVAMTVCVAGIVLVFVAFAGDEAYASPILQPPVHVATLAAGARPMRSTCISHILLPLPAASISAWVEAWCRTATALVRDSTQWTQGRARNTENLINTPICRTHQYGLERTQANS
jgi:hypothetical protein